MKRMLSKFSQWTLWSERQLLGEALGSPGVYLLKRMPVGSDRAAVTLDEPFVYIGETCDQSLRVRLNQFHRSGFSGRAAHSGGLTFFSRFGLSAPPAWLHLAVLPVRDEEPKSSAFIRYVERLLLWEHVCRHGALPTCNTK
jgi:hypothetical protein